MFLFLRPPRRTARSFRPTLETLEDRTQPAGFAGLGAAAPFGLLGLQNAAISLTGASVNGDAGVSPGGRLTNNSSSTVTGRVYAAAAGQYSGSGQVGGVVVDAALLDRADADALNASAQAAALAPTQTFGAISRATTVTGSGGFNVINVNGNVTASLTLSGSASDFFVVNVTGSLTFGGTGSQLGGGGLLGGLLGGLVYTNASLGLAGGLTADHVLYNFTGASGSVTTHSGDVVNGTLLAPGYTFSVGGTFNGGLIGGKMTLASGTRVAELPFAYRPAPVMSLSGSVYVDNNSDGVREDGESGIGGVTILLTGTDVNGNSVSLSVVTDADGRYSFEGLLAGTYTLTKQQPAFGPFVSGSASAGTVNGQSDGTVQNADTITNIVLNPGDSGIGYDFGDLPRNR